MNMHNEKLSAAGRPLQSPNWRRFAAFHRPAASETVQEFYAELSDAEMKDRQEFTFEAAVRMRDRFLQQEVWERMGVPVKDAVRLVMADEGRKEFQNILFSKIVPNCKKLGLLDRNDYWLRKKFSEINVIQFEDWTDTGEEYELLDEVAKDRAAAESA